METHRLVVPRSARYATMGTIDDTKSRTSGWFCHGYGQLATEFLESVSVLRRSSRVLVAPEALSRFYHEDHKRRVGASWMTREDRLHEMDDYLRYLDLVHDTLFQDDGSRRRHGSDFVGYSQGAATAARWAVRGAARIDHLMLWGSPLPPELDDAESLEPLSRMSVTLVRGTRDTFLDGRAMERATAGAARATRCSLRHEKLRGGSSDGRRQTLNALAAS